MILQLSYDGVYVMFKLKGAVWGQTMDSIKAFLEAECAAGYPLKAFSEKLARLLPAENLQELRIVATNGELCRG